MSCQSIWRDSKIRDNKCEIGSDSFKMSMPHNMIVVGYLCYMLLHWRDGKLDGLLWNAHKFGKWNVEKYFGCGIYLLFIIDAYCFVRFVPCLVAISNGLPLCRPRSQGNASIILTMLTHRISCLIKSKQWTTLSFRHMMSWAYSTDLVVHSSIQPV